MTGMYSPEMFEAMREAAPDLEQRLRECGEAASRDRSLLLGIARAGLLSLASRERVAVLLRLKGVVFAGDDARREAFDELTDEDRLTICRACSVLLVQVTVTAEIGDDSTVSETGGQVE